MDAETATTFQEIDAILAELAEAATGLRELYGAAYRGEVRPLQAASDEAELHARLDAAYARFSRGVS